MPQNPTYDIVLGGVGLTLARANQLQEGARAWKVEVTHNPVSATTPDSAKYGGVGQQVEMPLVWDDLSGGYGSWNDRVERKYHWGYGVDCRFPKMVLSGPLVTTVTLTDTTPDPDESSTAPASDFEEHDGKLWVIGGRYVFAITPADYSVTRGYDLGSGKTVTDIEEWKGTLYAGNGFAANDFISSHAGGAAVGTWTEDGDVQRGYLWPLWDKLYGTDTAYSVKAVSTDPFTAADWTAAYTIGDTHTAITSMAALEDELYVGKEDGVHGLDTSGIGTMLSPELRQYRCSINCKRMIVWHGTLIVPHLRGLLQYTSRGDGTHSVTPIGPGRGAVTDNPIRGHVTAVCGDEKYLYCAVWTGAYNSTTGTTYILAGCPDARTGDWAWHPLAVFAANKRCDAMFISSLWTNPHLWMGYGNDVAYIKLPRGVDNPALDTNCTYALTGTLRYQRHDLNAPASYKVWKSIELEADNLTPDRYITVYTRVDNGEWRSWGNAYQSPRTVIPFGASGIAGKTIELRLDFAMTTSDTPIILRSTCLRAAERPNAIENITAVVRCDDRISLRNSGRSSRTGAELWTELRTMLDHSGAVTLIDPIGVERQVLVIAPLEHSEARSEGDIAPEYLATVRMVEWQSEDVNMRIITIPLGYGATEWEIPWEIPWNIGNGDASASKTINYTGTAVSYPIITVGGPITGLAMSVTRPSGLTQSYSGGNISAGIIHTINCKTGSVTSSDIYGSKLNDIGQFFLSPGSNTITVSGTSINGNTFVRIAYPMEYAVV
jgi:hypothetical protein